MFVAIITHNNPLALSNFFSIAFEGNFLQEKAHKITQNNASKNSLLFFGTSRLQNDFSLSLLNAYDKARCDRYPSLIHNADFQVSRVLLYKCINFCFTNRNLSHSHQNALLGLSMRRIGVDLELIQPRKWEGIVDFCFNEYEKNLLRKIQGNCNASILEEFYRIYTIKESLLKLNNLELANIANVGLYEKKIMQTSRNLDTRLYKCFIKQENTIKNAICLSGIITLENKNFAFCVAFEDF